MRVHEDPARLSPNDFTNPVVTIGVFDGLHIGHRKLLAELREWAGQLGGQSLVITFRAHPRTVVSRSGPTHITSLPHRLMLLERQGIDACLLLEFTPALADMSAENFSREFLVERIGIKGLLVGFDSRIGRGGEGTPERMAEISGHLGFELRQFPAVEMDGETVSSTLVREKIVAGELAEAEKMLGRPVTVYGRVVKGEGRGRKLGFPTANLDLHHEARPPSGVYAGIAILPEAQMPALVSIGSRPTFHPESDRETIEVHIPGYEGDLYGRDMEVRFVCRIRQQRSFGNARELVERMQKDAQELEQLMRRTDSGQKQGNSC